MTVGITPTYSSLLIVNVIFPSGIKVEAVINTVTSGPIVSLKVASKLGMLKRASETGILQADGRTLKGSKMVVNSSFKFLNSSSSLSKDKSTIGISLPLLFIDPVPLLLLFLLTSLKISILMQKCYILDSEI